MANWDDTIIDLTDSFSLTTRRSLADVVIVLDTDESFDDSLSDQNRRNKTDFSDNKTGRNKRRSRSITATTSSNKRDKKVRNRSHSLSLGDCPICWDPLGRNPLASTKCGHVYCMKCLERTLKFERKCPTCRQVLKGSSAYHPIYLN